MKIEVGKWYKVKYRNGYRAYIGYRIPDEAYNSGGFNYVGYVASKDSMISYQDSWNEFGKSVSASEHQLIEEWKEPRTGEAWVNVYDNGLIGQGQYSVKNAEETAKSSSIAHNSKRIARIKIKWTEGQFDD